MRYCLLRIAKAPSHKQWGGMVYAEGDVLDGIGPCLSREAVEALARAQWPTLEVEPEDCLRVDGESLTGYAAFDHDLTHPGDA